SCFAALNDCIEGSECFINRGVGIRSMDLIQIDVIGVEAAQARVDRIEDMDSRETAVVRPFSHRHPAFGCKPASGPLAFEPFADYLFGLTSPVERNRHWIDIGCVNEIDSPLDSSIHYLERRLLIALVPKSHGAQAYFSHL